MRRSLLALLPLAALGIVAACMPDPPPEALGASSHEIVNGTPSPKFQDAVVFIDNASLQASCSGTIIAPNLVLTARHCVSDLNENDGCGSLKTNSPASALTVQTGANADGQNPDARGTKVFYPAGDTDIFCGNDIAIIEVDSPLAPKPRPIRFTAAAVGETVQTVGYGLDENGQDPGGRFQRTGMQILALGGTTFNFTRQDGTTTPVDVPAGNILTSEGACEGDSGGPLLDSGGNIIGTVSGGGTDEDTCTDQVDLFTALSQHEDDIRNVFQTVGATIPPPNDGDTNLDGGHHEGGHHDGGHHDGGWDGGHHHDGGWDGGHHHDGGYAGDDDDDDNGLGGSSGSVGVKPGKSGDDDDSDKSSPDSKDPTGSSSGAPKAASLGCSAARGASGSDDLVFGVGFVWALGLLAGRRRTGRADAQSGGRRKRYTR
jgi:hypothetical protein